MIHKQIFALFSDALIKISTGYNFVYVQVRGKRGRQGRHQHRLFKRFEVESVLDNYRNDFTL